MNDTSKVQASPFEEKQRSETESKTEEEEGEACNGREKESKNNLLKSEDFSENREQGGNSKDKNTTEEDGKNVSSRKKECRKGKIKELEKNENEVSIKQKMISSSKKKGSALERKERLDVDCEQENLSGSESWTEKEGKISKNNEKVESLWGKEQPDSPKLGQVLAKESWEVFCRNRPDLIREISVRVKESLTPESGRSCTDVSDPNASPSLSENSCGSVELRTLGKKTEFLEKERLKQMLKEEIKRREVDNRSNSRIRKEKESEEENAMEEKGKKKENDEEKSEKASLGNMEGGLKESETKGWKRTRMRLFDLGRKVALKQKEAKKVDRNTQTERRPTVRVKEQSVATEPAAPVEVRDWSCGVAFEAGEITKENLTDSATQTFREDEVLEGSEANWSCSEAEQNFSEDSLDSKANERDLSKTKEKRLRSRSKKLQTRVGKEKCEERKNGILCKWEGAGLYLLKLKARAITNENSPEESSLDSLEGDSKSEESEKLLSEESTDDEEFLFFGNTKTMSEREKGNREKERALYTIAENSEGSEESSSAAELNSFSIAFNTQNLGRTHFLSDSFLTHEKNKNSVKNQSFLKEFRKGKRRSFEERSAILNEDSRATTQVDYKKPSEVKKQFVSRGPEELFPTKENHRTSCGKERKSKKESNGKQEEYRTQTSMKTKGKSDVRKQSLNLKVPRNESGSVTAQLLDDSLTKSETMFGSSESVTFFYMGPARSETSVLMEVIKKSLEGRCKSSERGRESEDEKYFSEAALPRSVSVDTAVEALSRILGDKNEFKNVKKCASLETLREKEMPSVSREVTDIEHGENKKESGKKTENVGLEMEQNSRENIKLENFRERSETSDRRRKEKQIENYESENKKALEEEWEMGNGWSRRDRKELEGKRDIGERRVRFCKSEEELGTNEGAETLLKEARDLLKALNDKCRELLKETGTSVEGGIWNRERNFQRWREWEKEAYGTAEESEEKSFKADARVSATFTWPRARNGKCGKPPAGVRRRGARSRTEVRSERIGKILDGLRKEEPREPEEELEPSYSWKGTGDGDELWEPENESIQESWKRLLRAVEEDEARERRCKRVEAGATWMEKRKGKRGIARWEKSKCAGECKCEERRCASVRCDHCGGSNPELECCGTGARHCRDFCLRCRRAKTEAYGSTPQLNSCCSRERCRLPYYGFCPCTTAMPSRVTPSPRAYMRHLLGLRRKILDRSRL